VIRTAALLALLAAGAEPRRDPGPNIVLFIIDDMGWSDLGCMGSAFYETPNVDRLAAGGMRFTHAYSACTVCSPTRASLMTGKYPATLRVTDWIAGHKRPFAKLSVPDWTMHLPLEETTLAEALKTAGYATALFGKWHLGGPDFAPEKHGFDVNAGGDHRGQPPSYFAPYNIPSIPGGEKGEYLTDRLTTEAVKFIEASKERPFFAYFPHYAIHNPVQAKPALVEKYRNKAKPDGPHKNPAYAAMIESVDESVGRILASLDQAKIADRTIVIFTSDNGGLIPNTAQPPLRAGKGSAYEGGVRVPLLVRWPGAVKPGSVCETPVITPDLFATLVEAAGAKPPPGVEGESLAPLLRQSGGLQRDAIFWHYPHYHPGAATPYGAVRAGDWRLVEFYEDGRLELYDLKADPGEKENLAAAKPEKAAELRRRLDDWRKSVKAQMPTPNPDHDPAKDKAGGKGKGK
jgi:arylsulfatase A-like enzyme